MADRNDRHPKNAPGRFYSDAQCLDCDACHQTAPGIFVRDDASGSTFVIRQPETEEEIRQSIQAMEECGVDAIGDDGDVPGGSRPPLRPSARIPHDPLPPAPAAGIAGFLARIASVFPFH
jgi:ferredoxin